MRRLEQAGAPLIGFLVSCDSSTNSVKPIWKVSPEVVQELATAIQVSPETITPFHPDDIGAREKLRLASTRSATVAEDVAYSLIGIFKSDIIQPHYGEGDVTRAPARGDRDSFRRSTNHACLDWKGFSI